MQVIIYSRLSHPSALPNFLLAFFASFFFRGVRRNVTKKRDRKEVAAGLFANSKKEKGNGSRRRKDRGACVRVMQNFFFARSFSKV